jgi:hypothetical protein
MCRPKRPRPRALTLSVKLARADSEMTVGGNGGSSAYGDRVSRHARAQTIDRYGPDIAMPDLRHELVQCPHRRDMSNPCQVKYVD